jgi:hypothetical protein
VRFASCAAALRRTRTKTPTSSNGWRCERWVSTAIMRPVADGTRMIFLGFGKYARADKIYALEPLAEGERGHGRRTRVWIEGVPDPIIASRTERTILHDMGHDVSSSPIVDQALDLAERLAEQTEQGRVDLNDLGRRARRLLEATAVPNEAKLF